MLVNYLSLHAVNQVPVATHDNLEHALSYSISWLLRVYRLSVAEYAVSFSTYEHELTL